MYKEIIYGEYHKLPLNVRNSMANFQSPMIPSLQELYDDFWESYIAMNKDLRNDNALPYLLAPSQNYETANIRIMVCGKESMDWGHGKGEFNDINTNVNDLMKLYDFWINGIGGTITDNGSYGAFMDFYAHWFKYWFEDNVINDDKILSNKVKVTGKHIGCVAANVIKISHKGTGYDRELNNPFKYILKQEINILNPDIIVATVYNKNEISYREIIDKTFCLDTVNYDFNGNKEFRKITIDKKYIYLMRHPQCISYNLKNSVWNDIRLTILNELL